MDLDSIMVGTRIRIADPAGYTDERFTDWREITWLPPRETWGDRITVGFPDGTAWLRLDWPLERIQISAVSGPDLEFASTSHSSSA